MTESVFTVTMDEEQAENLARLLPLTDMTPQQAIELAITYGLRDLIMLHDKPTYPSISDEKIPF